MYFQIQTLHCSVFLFDFFYMAQAATGPALLTNAYTVFTGQLSTLHAGVLCRMCSQQ